MFSLHVCLAFEIGKVEVPQSTQARSHVLLLLVSSEVVNKRIILIARSDSAEDHRFKVRVCGTSPRMTKLDA